MSMKAISATATPLGSCGPISETWRPSVARATSAFLLELSGDRLSYMLGLPVSLRSERKEENEQRQVSRVSLSSFSRKQVQQRIISTRASSSDQSSTSSTAGTVLPSSERDAGAGEAEAREGGGDGEESEVDEEVDTLMKGMTFAELCNDFECVSSPAIERTARRLARDIHEMRESRRTLSCFAIDAQYRDPLRSFKGRDKYTRPSWLLNALEKPSVTMTAMSMRSTSELLIQWRLKGFFRLPGAALLGGELNLVVSSTFVLNQISGQVLEHSEEWDLSQASPGAALLFFSSRLAWTTAELSRDAVEATSAFTNLLDKPPEGNGDIYVDPRDPRKFFQEADPNRDLFQVGFIVALVYLLVQFLRLTI